MTKGEDAETREPGPPEEQNSAALGEADLSNGLAQDDGRPVAWIGSVLVAGQADEVAVILEERRGRQVIVRQVDPGEPTPDRVPIYAGEELVVMTALSHISLHSDENDSGGAGFLFAVRIVPVRSEPGVVFARTLRIGEPDDGRRVHLKPGESVVLEAGSVTAELDHIDSLEPATASGYVRLTPPLWTWLNLGAISDPAAVRYLLAGARRLDAANQLFVVVEDRRSDLQQAGLGGPQLRRLLFELLSAVEMAVVALGRAVDMVLRAGQLIGSPVPVPGPVKASEPALQAIRNAYEHIEDRALGQSRGKPHPDALTIFNQNRLLHDRVLTYGSFELDLATEVPAVLAHARQFLKDVSANA